jgi:2-polyprenyl-3-methyl-5-hydroxy-6-metoxy-1,4-benzoquinol methylase
MGSRKELGPLNTSDDTYLLKQGWEQERARLAGLSAQFDQVTVRHLGAVGVGSGWHCLEIGAGAGSIADWLAVTVGAAGRVMVTDIDTRFLGNVAVPHVEVVRHDVTSDPIEQDAFDLVHVRAVLEHVPDPGEVVARLVRALRPSGCWCWRTFWPAGRYSRRGRRWSARQGKGLR